MKQIVLKNGVVSFENPRAQVKNQANTVPARRMDRLNNLLSTKTPDICIRRGPGIGDVIMATPLIHELFHHFGGNANIYFATDVGYLDGALFKVLLHNPEIKGIIDWNSIDRDEFDTVLDIHCPCMDYEKRGNPPVNRIDLFARHVGFNKPLSDPKPRYYLQQKEVDEGRAYYQGLGFSDRDRVVLVNPFASNERRSLDTYKIRDALTYLYSQYGVKSIIVKHGSDFDKDTEWSSVPGTRIAWNLDIRQLGGLMVHTSMLLCPDSSLLHLAGALDFPTVTLFGPTDPRARINYFPQATAIWEGNKHNVCPCWWSKCPIGYYCWKAITSNMIVERIVKHFGESHKPSISALLSRASLTAIRSETL